MDRTQSCRNFQQGVACSCAFCTQMRSQPPQTSIANLATLFQGDNGAATADQPTLTHDSQPSTTEMANIEQLRGATTTTFNDRRMNGAARRPPFNRRSNAVANSGTFRGQRTPTGMTTSNRSGASETAVAVGQDQVQEEVPDVAPDNSPDAATEPGDAPTNKYMVTRESKYGEEPPKSAYGPPFEFKALVKGMSEEEMAARRAYNLQVAEAKKVYQRHKNNIAAKRSRERRQEQIDTLTSEVTTLNNRLAQSRARAAELEQSASQAKILEAENSRLRETVQQLRQENAILQRTLENLRGPAGSAGSPNYDGSAPEPFPMRTIQYEPRSQTQPPAVVTDQPMTGAHEGNRFASAEAGGQGSPPYHSDDNVDLGPLIVYNNRRREHESEPDDLDFDSLYD
ncbi:hypothetical protein F5Y16DRAFT_416123 [Xylariaceae sp. FL0255]|nr:hypothetical protein F5Y16DRAFT_416123 [Xylariaceae sp. FL0255]